MPDSQARFLLEASVQPVSETSASSFLKHVTSRSRPPCPPFRTLWMDRHSLFVTQDRIKAWVTITADRSQEALASQQVGYCSVL